jgi:mRNA-degrading endonuclease RelE of RelBE toxin-antitoxin system
MSDKTYNVELTSTAEKELASLKPYVEEIVKIILVLEKEPKAGHLLKGSLHRFRALEFSLPGSGQYRAAYVIIEDKKTCVVFAIGPHEGFYDNVKLRAKAIKKRHHIN